MLSICWSACLVALLPGGCLLVWPSDACGGCQGTIPVYACQTPHYTPSLTPSSPLNLSAEQGSPHAAYAYLLIPRLSLRFPYLWSWRTIFEARTSICTTQMHLVISLFPVWWGGSSAATTTTANTLPPICCIINSAFMNSVHFTPLPTLLHWIAIFMLCCSYWFSCTGLTLIQWTFIACSTSDLLPEQCLLAGCSNMRERRVKVTTAPEKNGSL